MGVQDRRRMRPATLAAIAALALGAGALSGCDGAEENGASGFTAGFIASGTLPEIGRVRIEKSFSTDRRVDLRVVIDGPDTSLDLYAFAFDLVLSNPAVAKFVEGSASAGDALQAFAGQDVSVIATQNGSRVVVGVTKNGGPPGNGVASAKATVVNLSFDILSAGTCALAFSGSPGNPQNPVLDPTALNPADAEILEVRFDDLPSYLTGD